MSKLSRFIRLLKDRAVRSSLREQGLIPIRQMAADDMTLVAYPKSGMTWAQNLLLAVRYGVRPCYVPNELVQTLIPDVHRERYFRRFHSRMFFKSHFLPRPEYRRVIYLLRDGRDVLVSYRYFLDSLRGTPSRYSELTGPRAKPWPCKWHEHVDQWHRNPFDAEMLVVRYEDLQAQPVRELQRICRFAGLQRSQSDLQRAVEQADIRKLRTQEAEYGNGGYLKGKSFFRRGKVGSHCDELPAEVLDAFLSEAGDTLRRCGYLTAADAMILPAMNLPVGGEERQDVRRSTTPATGPAPGSVRW